MLGVGVGCVADIFVVWNAGVVGSCADVVVVVVRVVVVYVDIVTFVAGDGVVVCVGTVVDVM